MLNAEDIGKFRAFIQACESDASILHQPQLAFFKAFLERLGATVPPAPGGKDDPPAQDPPKSAPTAEPTPEPAKPESESEESDVELDNSGVVEPDMGDSQPMGDSEKEVTEEEQDRSGEKRSEAQTAFCDGDFEKAADLYTEAIIINPVSALFHAKRAACYLKLERPCAAVRDCDKAIQLNPDSATAYKFRGRAYRLLGKWEEAANDLRTACKLDFDEQADEWLKEVTPNASKLTEHRRKYQRRQEERELRQRKERVRLAREQHAKAREEQKKADEDEGGMPDGIPPGMAGLFQDPEVMAAMQDPDVMAAFADVSQNPANIMKYQNNPKIMALIAKMSGKMGGGGGGFPGGMGGFPGGMGGGFPGGMGGFPGGMGGPGNGAAPTKGPDMDVD